MTITINILIHNSGGTPLPEKTQSALIGAISDAMDEHHPGIGAIAFEIEDTSEEETQ